MHGAFHDIHRPNPPPLLHPLTLLPQATTTATPPTTRQLPKPAPSPSAPPPALTHAHHTPTMARSWTYLPLAPVSNRLGTPQTLPPTPSAAPAWLPPMWQGLPPFSGPPTRPPARIRFRPRSRARRRPARSRMRGRAAPTACCTRKCDSSRRHTLVKCEVSMRFRFDDAVRSYDPALQVVEPQGCLAC